MGRLHLTEGLDLNQRQLGATEELLLSVQTDVNSAERKLFGKVFDLQSERNFLARHQELVSENDEFKDSMEGLNDKIATLSSHLEQAQRKFMAVKHQQQKAERHLKEQVSENDFTISGLQKELSDSHLIEKDHDRLTELNRALVNESMEISVAAQAADHELQEAKKEMHKEESMIQPNLQKQLVQQHTYGVSCHQKVHQLDLELRAVLAAKPLQSSAEKAAAEHAEQADEAADQRLKIENEFLKQQMQHAEGVLAGMEESQREADAKLAQLKLEIEKERKAVLFAMGNLREHMTTMQDSMEQNINQRKAKENQLITEMEVLSDLQEKMSAGGFANLKNENAKLKAMLQTQQAKLLTAQSEEAEAKAFEQEKEAENAALQATAHNSQEKAEQAMRDAQKEVARAAQESARDQDKAKGTMEQAEAAVAEKCKPDWDKRTSKAEKKKAECEEWQDELYAANAEIETLKVSLEAAALT